MTQNVVTYTVVIAVDNASGRLLPYLTARLQFEVETRKGVLLVPNAALRWQPHLQNIVAEAKGGLELTSRRQTAASSSNEPMGLLWIRQGDLVRPIKIRIGLSDGLVTEISGDGLAEGTEIVVGANRIDSEPDALSILPHTWSDLPRNRRRTTHGPVPAKLETRSWSLSSWEEIHRQVFTREGDRCPCSGASHSIAQREHWVALADALGSGKTTLINLVGFL